MSTRAVYTFKDAYDTSHVYKHHDGYPSGGLEFIALATIYAWPLPRFEAKEFGAAFIRANKDEAGGVYLTSSYKNHGDLEYRYQITSMNKTLYIEIFKKDYNDDDYSWKRYDDGRLEELCLKHKVNLKEVNQIKLAYLKAQEQKMQEINDYYSKMKLVPISQKNN
jgi:hypothetical protein